MKIRIRGNSVRIRVSQSELEQLAQGGVVEDRIRFSPQAELGYRVRVVPHGEVRGELADGRITVIVPRSALERWLEPSEVSIRGEQPVGSGEALKILVEKDFTCVTPREDEDQSDLFPNPTQQAC